MRRLIVQFRKLAIQNGVSLFPAGSRVSPRRATPRLARIRADRERYRQTHPQDVAEIEAMAREVAKTKRCKV